MTDIDNRDRFHSRKNPRLKDYDYSQPNYFFVTICTKEMRQLFGKAGVPNWRGKVAEKGLLEIRKHFPSVRVDKYVIMPNHIHAIIVQQEKDARLPTVVGLYKAYVTRQIHIREPQCEVWQASFHDHVIRNREAYERIWLYIDANPQNWERDCFYEKAAQP